MNGHELVATEVDAVATFIELASGGLDEDELATWIERNSRTRS